MKKIGTLALTLALAGSLTVPALAAEETAVPACCAFLEGAVPPSNRVPSRPAVSRWTRW